MRLQLEQPPAGWRTDRDGWLVRPALAADRALDFSNSRHAFIENGKLHCRDADQARKLDQGIAV